MTIHDIIKYYTIIVLYINLYLLLFQPSELRSVDLNKLFKIVTEWESKLFCMLKNILTNRVFRQKQNIPLSVSKT